MTINPEGYKYGMEPINKNPFWGGGSGGDINIEADATVDDTTGTPDVSVQKTEEGDTTTFTFNFTGLKGETGETGATGPTGPQGSQGPAGIGVPTGGDAGDVLTKYGTGQEENYFATPHYIPAGGNLGQVLKKYSDDDYAAMWSDPAGSQYKPDKIATGFNNNTIIGTNGSVSFSPSPSNSEIAETWGSADNPFTFQGIITSDATQLTTPADILQLFRLDSNCYSYVSAYSKNGSGTEYDVLRTVEQVAHIDFSQNGTDFYEFDNIRFKTITDVVHIYSGAEVPLFEDTYTEFIESATLKNNIENYISQGYSFRVRLEANTKLRAFNAAPTDNFTITLNVGSVESSGGFQIYNWVGIS